MLGLGAVISPKAKSHVLRGSLETTGETGSYIAIPITNSLFRGNHSWSAWIKLPVSNINSIQIGYRHAIKSARQEYFLSILGQNAGGNAGQIYFSHRSTDVSRKASTSDIIKNDSRAGGWYNIVVTSESRNSGAYVAVTVYVNGSAGTTGEVFALTENQRAVFDPTSHFLFGGLNITGNAQISHNLPYKIRLSSFTAWGAVLSPHEITAIYKGGRGIKMHRNKGNYISANHLRLDYNFNSGRKDGVYKSTGSDNAPRDNAIAVNCKHVSDHPSHSKGRLQG